MKKKKSIIFSIIIPVFNCEKYILKCVNSILNQDNDNLEIILVDDGSTDKSRKICDDLSNEYQNVIVIHKDNTGVSDSRNVGISIAKGKYILFSDADDYFENNYFKEINKIISKYSDIELINFAFYSDVNNEFDVISSDIIKYKSKYYKSKKELKRDFVDLWDSAMLYNVWNKVYLKKIIDENDVKFPNMYFGEDIEFNKLYLNYIEKFYNSEKGFYHYVRERSGAATNRYKKDIFEIRKNEFYMFNKYFEEWEIPKNDYYEFSCRRYIERVLGCIENIYCTKIKFFERYRSIKELIDDELTRHAIKYIIPKSKKIKIMLIPIKYRLTILSMVMGRIINIIKNTCPAIFNKLKNSR